MDEPLAGLDAATQERIVALLKTLREAKKTLVFATHNEGLVEQIADVRVRMKSGKIIDVS